MKLIHFTKYAVWLFCLLQLTVSCSDEYETGGGGGTDSSDGIRFTVSVPGLNTPQTRAISDVDESEIRTIDILVFKKNASDETFLYKTHGANISGTGNTRSFTANLKNSADASEQHRFVFLANLRTQVDAALPSFTTATTKQQALDAIAFSASAAWNTASSSNFTPLPMWGESAGTYVVTNQLKASDVGTIALMRSLARVDVGLNFSGESVLGLSNFSLSDVQVFNYMDRGAAAPLPANLSAGLAVTPTVPATAVRTAGPLTYSHATPGNSFIREIYLAENAVTGNKSTEACLVLGGYFNGSPTKTWYRIDFFKRMVNAGDPQVRLPLLRNFRYKVNITAVDGPGYATATEAFNANAANLKAEVLVWDESSIKEIVFDNQYMLGVSQSSYLFDSGARTALSADNSLLVTTTVPTGWSVDKYTDELGNPVTWLSLSPATGAVGTTTSTRLIASFADDYRKARVYLKAGKLTAMISVTQQAPPYGSADILYFKSDGTLDIGKWGIVTQSNIANFKFGSVIGFTNTSASDSWDAGDVKFNTTGATTYGTYTNIPVYTSADYNAGRTNVSASTYHNGMNVKSGKGDPCILVGLTGVQIQSMTAAQLDAYDSGWRLPTANENVDFVGAPTSWYNSTSNPALSQSTCNYWAAAPNGAGNGGWFPIPGDRNATTGRTVRNTSPNGYLPAAGLRYTDGSSGGIGTLDFNWSGSAISSSNGCCLVFSSSNVFPLNLSNFGCGYTVRCVRQ